MPSLRHDLTAPRYWSAPVDLDPLAARLLAAADDETLELLREVGIDRQPHTHDWHEYGQEIDLFGCVRPLVYCQTCGARQ